MNNKANFFNQICTEEIIVLPASLPDIEQIISSVADFEIISLKVISTIKGKSYEGQELFGKKLVVEFKLRQKILYFSEIETQSVHIFENELYQTAYIVIPELIEGTNPAVLIKQKLLKCKIDTEAIHFSKMDKRKIYKNLCLLISAEAAPASEIGCCVHYSSKKSDILIMNNDGTHVINVNSREGQKHYKPEWSPNGRDLAYISEINNKKLLNIYNLKTFINRQLDCTGIFNYIGSFCWSPNSSNIFITGRIDGTENEIFQISSSDVLIKQLTEGNGIYDSYLPKASPDGKQIAFLRSYNGLAGLWLMNNEGGECKRLSSYGTVKSFDWSKDGNSLVYVYINEQKKDVVCVHHIPESKNKEMEIKLPNKRKARFSPDGTCFAFIGANFNSEDIYVYRFKEDKLGNITNNCDHTKIADFVWSADSDKIYYSGNDLFYYNIYMVYIDDKYKQQLTNNNADKIELSYRPRIS